MVGSKLGEKYAVAAVKEAFASLGAAGVVKVMRELAEADVQLAHSVEAAMASRTLANRLWHAQQLLEAQ